MLYAISIINHNHTILFCHAHELSMRQYKLCRLSSLILYIISYVNCTVIANNYYCVCFSYFNKIRLYTKSVTDR